MMSTVGSMLSRKELEEDTAGQLLREVPSFPAASDVRAVGKTFKNPVFSKN